MMAYKINDLEYDVTHRPPTRPPGFAFALASRNMLILNHDQCIIDICLGENCTAIKLMNKSCNENVKDVQIGIQVTMPDYARAVAVDPKL